MMKRLFNHAFRLGKNTNTSVASIISRMAMRKIEQKFGTTIAKAIGKKTATILFQRGATAFGRFVPFLGWALVANDVWTYREEIYNFGMGLGQGTADLLNMHDPNIDYMMLK